MPVSLAEVVSQFMALQYGLTPKPLTPDELTPDEMVLTPLRSFSVPRPMSEAKTSAVPELSSRRKACQRRPPMLMLLAPTGMAAVVQVDTPLEQVPPSEALFWKRLFQLATRACRSALLQLVTPVALFRPP